MDSLVWLEGSRGHRLQQLHHMGSLVVAHRLQSMWAQWLWSVACGVLGIESASHALQGRFLITGTPGKSLELETYVLIFPFACDKIYNTFSILFLHFYVLINTKEI